MPRPGQTFWPEKQYFPFEAVTVVVTEMAVVREVVFQEGGSGAPGHFISESTAVDHVGVFHQALHLSVCISGVKPHYLQSRLLVWLGIFRKLASVEYKADLSTIWPILKLWLQECVGHKLQFQNHMSKNCNLIFLQSHLIFILNPISV